MDMRLPPGEFRYQVVKELGRGGFGIVEQVRVTETNCCHAIGTELASKKLGEQWKADPQARERFEREIVATQSMTHPNIVACVGTNLPGGERRYFMTLYRESLRDRLLSPAGLKGFEWRSVARFGATLAYALSYAHVRGNIHRDLKPENVLLGDQGPAISDWGVGRFLHKASRVLQPALTRAGIGTEYYCSAEQWATGAADERADIYSLGVVLAECVIGRPPKLQLPGFGIQTDVIADGARACRVFNDTIRSMTRLLAKDRISSMLEVAQLLTFADESASSVA